MARCIPNVLHEKATAGEKALFHQLRSLPDDWLVYSEPFIRNRYPDFVVIAPGLGVAVIEVKDWQISTVKDLNKDSALLAREDGTVPVNNPLAQAFRYANEIKKQFTSSPHSKRLQAGGDLRFNVRPLVVLRNITRDQLEQRGWSHFVSREFVLANNEYSEFGASLAENLGHYLRQKRQHSLSDKEVAIIRSVIRPECVVEDDGVHLAMLDIKQEQFANVSFGGHRVIYGPAGSGKTVVLVARAKLLANSGRRCLVLCYNKPLQEWLDRTLRPYAVEVRTFHSWAFRNGFEFSRFHDIAGNEDREALGAAFLAALNSSGLQKKYDCILIDEVQEFDPSWVRCAVAALAEGGDFFLAGDGEQSPRTTFKINYKDLGIAVQGGGRSKNFKKVYRNTKQIWEASCALNSQVAGEFDSEDQLRRGSAYIIPPSHTGPDVKIVQLRSQEDEYEHVIDCIRIWLRERVALPREIAVLSPWQNSREKLCQHALPDGVDVLTIQRCKGLQWRHVFIIHADRLRNNEFASGGDARQWLQIAMRRATYSLTILSSGPCDLVDRIERHIARPRYARHEITAKCSR